MGNAEAGSRPVAVCAGGLMLNRRAVERALSLLLHPERHEGTHLSLPELSTVLGFLEAVALGDRLYLDGTAPTTITGSTDELLEGLRARIGRRDRAVVPRALAPAPYETVELATEAAQESELLLVDLDPRTSTAADGRASGPTPLAAGPTRRFVTTLEQLAHVGEEARHRAASDLVADNAFIGSKCLAGLLLADGTQGRLDEHVRGLLAHRGEEEQGRLVAAVIDRFRVSYLPALARLHDACYLASPRLEPLRTRQTLLFTRYLARRLGEQARARLPRATEGLREEFDAFPLGWAILMRRTRTPSHPVELLEDALRQRQGRLARATAGPQPDTAHHVRMLSPEEVRALEDEYFGDLFDAAAQPTRARPPWVRGTSFALPGLGLALDLATGGPWGTLASGVATAASGDRARDLRERLAGRAPVTAYRDAYRDFSTMMEQALTTAHEREGFARRVTTVFGKPPSL